MPQLVADLQSGRLQHVYQAAQLAATSTTTPVPRWDLIDLRHYVTMAVQFSRGCPFDCEFCDIIVMNGRVPRTKIAGAGRSPNWRRCGARGWKDMVFIVDDNFIGDKRRTKALLREMIEWRRRTRPQMGFLTEASVNLADDPELCALMVAGRVQEGVRRASRRRRPRRWRNAASCRTGAAISWPRCRRCSSAGSR